MSSVGLMMDRKDRPAYVRFERRAIEDRTAQSIGGRWPRRDVDFALVTPPYSRDVFEAVAEEWLAQMDRDAQAGRLPQEWAERYRQQYERWKAGEELPPNGEPIKGWGVISPAQQANLIGLNIRTVEDLAAVNDEGKRRIGMGAQELQDKAKAWLSQMKDKGPLTLENASLRAENVTLKTTNAHLEARVKELSDRVEFLQRGGLDRQHFDRQEPSAAENEIAASDILEEAPKRRRKQSEAPI